MILVGHELPRNVVINQPVVSAVHATFEFVGPETVRFIDLQSSNDTFVDGRRITDVHEQVKPVLKVVDATRACYEFNRAACSRAAEKLTDR